ncbi:hypothetical protein D3C72_2206710 [compost metagenome]
MRGSSSPLKVAQTLIPRPFSSSKLQAGTRYFLNSPVSSSFLVLLVTSRIFPMTFSQAPNQSKFKRPFTGALAVITALTSCAS